MAALCDAEYLCVGNGWLFLFIFIYSLLGMQMYGGNFEFEDNDVRSNFNSFFYSFVSVF